MATLLYIVAVARRHRIPTPVATARTTITDYWQEQQKSLSLPFESVENNPIVLLEPQIDEQTQKRVYHLLHLLPERERKVLLLRYFHGYSIAPERDAKEIIDAGNGGLSVATISYGSKMQTTFRAYATL